MSAPTCPDRLAPLVLSGTQKITAESLSDLALLEECRQAHAYAIFTCEAGARGGLKFSLAEVIEDILIDARRRRPRWIPQAVWVEIRAAGWERLVAELIPLE
ncbi:hypothetical protein [Deinococcus marmoris]|uniref:hypothetical protein n=1 Tax=Deinococcus marmoris TaxID=249408 RepID=UPI000495D0CF|nr:hypothetical protein [Deinococcus marmoris]